GEVRNDWTYTLNIKPRPVIIDDVIITDEEGHSYVVMDRNVQNIYTTGIPAICGRDKDGKRMQAYHYCGWKEMKIPFKFNGVSPMPELYHKDFQGDARPLNNSLFMFDHSKDTWLNYFIFKNNMPKNSPSYDSETIGKWTYPNSTILEDCRAKMKVSKMRMFLMSETPAFGDDGASIPICCYFPFLGDDLDAIKSIPQGYLSVESTQSDLSSESGLIFNVGSQSVITTPIKSTSQEVVMRLVYPLTQSELEEYKTNFLGYGDSPLTLSPCHQDTYDKWPTFTPVK
ncbi:MAG: hypothetical protein K2K25_09710, partial [Muribaculaceae bacterium]|nr:hypothetical protein [Muribaculaceae bacterium]